jgi:hypothetical protein
MSSITSRERAAWGVSIPRAFTRDEKKLWTKEEKAMYKAFELHGKDQALKMMRSYFARKKTEVGDEDETFERGVAMTCTLLNFRKQVKDHDDTATAAEENSNKDEKESPGTEFGDDEQRRFKEAVAAIAGLEDIEESAISITKIADVADPKDSNRLAVTFEITTSDGAGDATNDGKTATSADHIADKLNATNRFISSLAKKQFPGVQVVHPAEVIGGARAAKKARKSMMAHLYGDPSADQKGGHCEGEKHKEAD